MRCLNHCPFPSGHPPCKNFLQIFLWTLVGGMMMMKGDDLDLDPCETVCDLPECFFTQCSFSKLTRDSPNLMFRDRTKLSLEFVSVKIVSISPSFFNNLSLEYLIFDNCLIDENVPIDLFNGLQSIFRIQITDVGKLEDLFWENEKFTEPLTDKIRSFELSQNLPSKCPKHFFKKFTKLSQFVFKHDIVNFDFMEDLKKIKKITFQFMGFGNVFNCMKVLSLRKSLISLVFEHVSYLTLDFRYLRRLRNLRHISEYDSEHLQVVETILKLVPGLNLTLEDPVMQSMILKHKVHATFKTRPTRPPRPTQSKVEQNTAYDESPATVVDTVATLDRKKTFRLTCYVVGKFPIDIVIIDPDGVESRYSQPVKSSNYSVTYNFKNFSMNSLRDKGSYFCYANNSLGTSVKQEITMPNIQLKSSLKSCRVRASLLLTMLAAALSMVFKWLEELLDGS